MREFGGSDDPEEYLPVVVVIPIREYPAELTKTGFFRNPANPLGNPSSE
eukprot:CAMPEP_0201153362 /NCGR_PEP_ID=MMETSP0851-20130426/13812_1 /ASSEMBLY_ACC=CAM_ASM_000631 /TAXON_ID=183588 /ORGANISM="Pseudo-nitzschia fraudulenta, Strain WWA7" /LENGTH=48 /DNA_ID= /DNA_START= /DNA_END= /DNA_ORIENTATION=